VAAEQLALTGRPGAVPDLLVVRGGRVESLRPDGAMRWRSPAFGALSITSVVDLNGDGRLEVLARSQRQLRAFDAITGTLRILRPLPSTVTLSTAPQGACARVIDRASEIRRPAP
jgi:hypothetical protein